MNINPTESEKEALEQTAYLVKFGPMMGILDTETTGLDAAARIVDICLLDIDGNPIIDTLINPEIHIPEEASAVHGITDEMVKDAPTWAQVSDQVRMAISTRFILTYNLDFDIRMVNQMEALIGNQAVYIAQSGCLMELFAAYYGEWDDYHGHYRWKKLTEACKHLDIPYSHQAIHSAKADADLARKVLLVMAARSHKPEFTALIDEHIRTLATARSKAAALSAKMRQMETDLHATPEWQKMDTELVALKAIIQVADSSARQAAVDFYKGARDKAPHPAVGIRSKTIVEYGEAQALDWCTKNLPLAVVLDRGLFEKHAKAIQKTQPIEFVKISAEAEATVASDLSAYVTPDPEPVPCAYCGNPIEKPVVAEINRYGGSDMKAFCSDQCAAWAQMSTEG